MKVRGSGMPGEDYWGTFFDPDCVVGELGCSDSRRGLVEFGCGYGTFTAPAARIAQGSIIALDIEPEMVAATRRKVHLCGLSDVVERRDFIEDGCGRPDASVDHVMLFNILHLEDPVRLLAEAYRALIPGAG